MNSKDLSDIRHKPKEFITPDSYQIGSQIQGLKRSAQEMIGAVHSVTNDHQMHITKVRGDLAIRLITRAIRIVLAMKEIRKSRQLKDRERQQVVKLVEEVLNGRRQAVQFQATLDGNGLVELFSNEVILSEEDQILKL